MKTKDKLKAIRDAQTTLINSTEFKGCCLLLSESLIKSFANFKDRKVIIQSFTVHFRPIWAETSKYDMESAYWLSSRYSSSKEDKEFRIMILELFYQILANPIYKD